MTTIAYKDGVVVADRLASRSGWAWAEVDKIVQKGSWTLTGVGDLATVCAFQRNFSLALDDLDAFLPAEEETTLLAFGGGSIFALEKGGRLEIDPNKFYAWGSGFPVALGAMHAGATALQAVRIAALVDREGTGEDIDMVVPEGFRK